MPQASTSCAGIGCTVGTQGYNYAVVSSVIGANVSIDIPTGYHICKYSDAPGIGKYFSPSYYSSTLNNTTCQERYPDAEVVQ